MVLTIRFFSTTKRGVQLGACVLDILTYLADTHQVRSKDVSTEKSARTDIGYRTRRNSKYFSR